MGVIDVRPPARPRTTAPALPPINRDQAQALAELQGVLFGRRGRALLEGRAGTGKTRLIVELVRRWPGPVAVCAPTHKAAAVLHQMLLADPTIDVAAGFARGSQRCQAPGDFPDDGEEDETEGRGRWDDRWRIRAALADIRHLYAVTTHTSQGSTYDVVFVDMRDLLLSGMADRMTRLKLFYTAATRPSLQLGVYWEPLPGFV